MLRVCRKLSFGGQMNGGLMDLTWTGDLSVGNAMIDSAHRKLLEIADGVVHAIELEDCMAFSQAFEQFENQLRIHYASEERIAQAVRFPYARYKMADQHFLRELDLFKQELLSRSCQCCGEAIKHYSESMKALLVDHITEKCRLMKPFLQNYPYELSLAGA
jgi:hemerythrin-like metal-binding protein